MIAKREDLKVAGRIVAVSTEGVVADASQLYSEDYISKYGKNSQFSTDGFQSSINDKFVEQFQNLKQKIDSSVSAGAISIEWLNTNLI